MIAPVTFATLALAVAPSMANHASFNHNNVLRHRHIRRRLDTLVIKRKIIGWGDSTTKPANVAQGSDDASCTCWHEVAAGEVCLGLIDKSSAGFTLDKFFKLNPSLDNDCGNLQTGVSYCVDDGANTSASGTDTKATPSSALVAAKQAFSQVASVAAASTGSCDADEDEEDDEDEDTYTAPAPAATTSKPAAKAQVEVKAAAVQAPAQQQQQQQQPQQDTWTSSSQQTWAAATTSSSTWQAPQSTQAQAGAGVTVGVGAVNTGTSTYYYQNNTPGSCGTVSSDDDFVAAIFTGAEWGKSDCGRMAKVTNTVTGASVDVKVMDTCPTCYGQTHIDLSVAAFLKLGALSQGVLQTTWQFTS